MGPPASRQVLPHMRPMLFLLALVATTVSAAPSYDYVDVAGIGMG